MARILIAGCGEVGLALLRALDACGHEVWGLRRSDAVSQQPLRFLRADLARPDSLWVIPEALDLVFYLASADRTSDEAYAAAYVQNLQNLLAALDARREMPERIFYASSTSVYAQADDEWIDENSPTEPEHFAGKRLLEGEAALRASGFPFCIVRFSGIYSAKKRALLERVARSARSESENSPYTNRIHLADCAGLLAYLAMQDAPADLYLASDSEPTRLTDVENWIAMELKKRNSSVLSRILEARDRALGGTARPARQRNTSKRCRNARLLEAGYAFRYSNFREGYAAILDELEVSRDASGTESREES